MLKSKLFFCLMLTLVMFCGWSQTPVCYAQKPVGEYGLYKYEGIVPHFFCHQLIRDPALAFSEKNSLRWAFYKDCTTANEFYNFLVEMEKSDYVLVDIFDVYEVSSDGCYKKDLFVPLGKKPFLLSLDDMSFDAVGKGLSDRIVLTPEGEIGSYTVLDRSNIEFDKESIPILEQFIKKHPHFCYNNARMVICPTGYNGILGYRITNKLYQPQQDEIEKIKPLVAKLKELGYRFASHTYNHINCAYVNIDTLKDDLNKYERLILSVVGETPILSFPGGKWSEKSGRLNLLNSMGYKLFFCVGMKNEYEQIGNSIFLRRYCLDNSAFSTYKKDFQKYVNIDNIKDSMRDLI